jgi:hypothetical protein
LIVTSRQQDKNETTNEKKNVREETLNGKRRNGMSRVEDYILTSLLFGWLSDGILQCHQLYIAGNVILGAKYKEKSER